MIRDEARLDAAAWQHLLEQLQRSAIDVEHGDDLVAGLAGYQGRNQFRRHPAGGGDCGFGSFQRGNLLFGGRDRGVAVARIKIQVAIALGVAAQRFDIGKNEDRGLRDGRGQGRRLAVPLFAGMHTARGVGAGFPVHPQSFRKYFSSSGNSIVIETQGEQMEWLPVIQPQSAAGAKNISYKF